MSITDAFGMNRVEIDRAHEQQEGGHVRWHGQRRSCGDFRLMVQAGLLTEVEEAAGVELGCGTAYLANAVVDCSGLQRMVLVDSGHFRHKADRCASALLSVTRLTCPIFHTGVKRQKRVGRRPLRHVYS